MFTTLHQLAQKYLLRYSGVSELGCYVVYHESSDKSPYPSIVKKYLNQSNFAFRKKNVIHSCYGWLSWSPGVLIADGEMLPVLLLIVN